MTGAGVAEGGPSVAEVVRILRFDRVQRAVHWANAVLFGIVILTALPLYFASLARLVGRHMLVEQIHVGAGIALVVPLLAAVVGPWGSQMRRDLRRVNRWSEAELRWLWSLGQRRIAAPDKFNPGQKLNTIFVGASIVVMLGTGIVLEWFGPFPVSWRTGATFVHEVLAWVIVVVIAGHIVMALTHPASLRSMITGWVTEAWARRHAAGWLAETRDRDPGPRAWHHGSRDDRGAT